jgi:hypothetical protein
MLVCPQPAHPKDARARARAYVGKVRVDLRVAYMNMNAHFYLLSTPMKSQARGGKGEYTLCDE